jgi:hypothetical protein
METVDQLEKARIYAYWGFSGILSPIIGLIAAAISISILDRLIIAKGDTDVIEESTRIRNTANGARAVAIIILVVEIIVVIWWLTRIASVASDITPTTTSSQTSNYQ